MKKIINGLLYNTETAKSVGRSETRNEELFLKKTGEFFICRHGIASNLSEIIPLSYEDAQKWAEKHLPLDECSMLFYPVPDDNKAEIVQMKFYLTAGTADSIRKTSRERGIMPSTLAEILLSKGLERLKS